MDVQTNVVSSTQNATVKGGRFFKLITGTSCNVEVIRNNTTIAFAEDVDGGYSAEFAERFHSIIISSSTAQTVKYGVSEDRGGYDNVSANVISDSLPFDKMDCQTDVSCSNGVSTRIFQWSAYTSSFSSVRELIIHSDQQGRIGVITSATIGIPIYTGEKAVIPCISGNDVYFYNTSGTTANVSVSVLGFSV